MANIRTVLDNVASGAIKLAASEYKGAYTPLPNIQVNVEGGESSDQSQTEVLFDGVINGTIHVKIKEGKPSQYPSYQYAVKEAFFEGERFEGNEFNIPPKNGILSIKLERRLYIRTYIWAVLVPELEELTADEKIKRLSIIKGDAVIYKEKSGYVSVYGNPQTGYQLKIDPIIDGEVRKVIWQTEEGDVQGDTVTFIEGGDWQPDMNAELRKE